MHITICCLCILTSCDNNINNMQETSIDTSICKEVSLEDYIEDYMLCPLQSEEPIDEITMGMAFDSIALYKTANTKEIYYFKNNKLISKLSSVGRGDGEYININAFTYNPFNNTIIVSTEKEDLNIYSLPGMNLVRTINSKINIKGMYAISDSTILTVSSNLKNTQNGTGICIVNLTDGTTSLIESTHYINNMFFMGNEFAKHNSSVLIPLSGYTNKILEYKDSKITTISSHSFKENNLPEKFRSDNYSNLDENYDFIIHLMQNNYILGCYNPIITDRQTTTWYTSKDINGNYKYMMLALNKDSYMNYSFHIPGINKIIIPDYVAGDYYAIIIQEPIETLTKESGNISELGKDIITTKKSQNYENPILLYFKIKQTL